MYDYFLVAISCLCFLPSGFHAENCSETVLARRETFHAPVGDSLSLSCVVQHCGDAWTGEWMWRNSTDNELRAIMEDSRHQITNVTLSGNQTQMRLKFVSVNELDEGSYACKVTWDRGGSAQGHWTYLNITAADPFQRNVYHRIFICAGAFICLPIILVLARCLSSERKPQPLPRTRFTARYRAQSHLAPQPPPRCPVPQKRSTSSHKAPPKSQQKTEVVYADISKAALDQQQAIREPAQSTVYSSLRFSQ